MSISSIVIAAKNAEKYHKVVLGATKVFKPVVKISHRFGPEILTGVGIAGGAGTVVLASRATLKLEGIVGDTETAMSLIEIDHNAGLIDDKEYHSKLRRAKAEGIFAIAKLYTPSVTLGLASTGAILAAHGVMRRRNVALVAAYKALETTFNEYRKRVVEEFGEEKDQDYRLGFTDETKTDKKTGETKTVTHVNNNGHSLYAKFFDEGSSSWSKTPDYNLVFLRSQQNWANDLLLTRGHLFLNEVYDMLGIERTQAGQAVGWVVDKDGDNYVDFGIYDFSSMQAREFVNGRERSILLDFNVDGVIIDKI